MEEGKPSLVVLPFDKFNEKLLNKESDSSENLGDYENGNTGHNLSDSPSDNDTEYDLPETSLEPGDIDDNIYHEDVNYYENDSLGDEDELPNNNELIENLNEEIAALKEEVRMKEVESIDSLLDSD